MVTLLLKKLGGTNLEDRGDKTAISEDHTQTWEKMLDASGNLSAEIAYKTLKASLSYENGDSTAAEDFTSAGGANETVNTGSTTALYSSSLNAYTLLDNFNLTSASYDSKSVNVNSQDSSPQDATFKTDGTKMYMMGNTTDTIYQYTLSTAWDLSTASYDSVSFSVNAQESTPTHVTFSQDGTRMFISGNTTDTIYQYTLSTAWDLSTASYDSKSYNPTEMSNIISVELKDDGTKMYLNSSSVTYQYTLSTAFDVTTATYDSISLSTSSSTQGNRFSLDGQYYMGCQSDSDIAYIYFLSIPWDISSGSLLGNFAVGGQDGAPFGIGIKDDGTKFYIVGNLNKVVYQYSMGAGLVPSGSFVLSDTNTLAVDDETNSFCLYWKGTFPINTTGSFDLSDGTNTINLPVNITTKKTGAISKDTLTNIDDVIIKPKLETTDTSVSPTIEGWGASKI